jgi:uncharacterized membrane protein YkvA (DUF1232 family)
MGWRKLWSLRHWAHVFTRVARLAVSPRVPLREKLLFGVPALLYWIFPDLLPWLPIDDIAVTMLLANWFSERLERKYHI